MTFWDHLDELRARLVRCLLFFFGGFAVAYFFSDQILDFLRQPLFQHLPPEKRQLYYTGLFENFLVHLRVSAFASLFLLSPVYFFILWKFISPGLKPGERKEAVPFAGAASLLFLGGAGFAYWVLFPTGVKYFLNYGTSAEVAWLTLETYISTLLRMMFGFGLCFQIPVVVVLLARFGIFSQEALAKSRRPAVIAITALAAMVAPPDAISMLLLMAPLYLLFEGALFVAKRVQKKPVNTN